LRVQLAYPWTDSEGNDHAPDDVVEVDDFTGRVMIREGNARRPDSDQMSMDELRSEARARGLDTKGLRSREQLEAALNVDPAGSVTVIRPGGSD
jgi:hypothetical protein